MKMTPDAWEQLHYFKPSELPHPEEMSWELMSRLDLMREFYGLPLIITSSYRLGDDGAHGDGDAVDLRVRGGFARKHMFIAAQHAGFPRIGMYDKHLHVDVSTRIPEAYWAGVSD